MERMEIKIYDLQSMINNHHRKLKRKRKLKNLKKYFISFLTSCIVILIILQSMSVAEAKRATHQKTADEYPPSGCKITVHHEKVIGDRYNTDIDVQYLAKVVNAEAGNQGDLGKRYVIDVILNRIDSPKFPNTLDGVIHQKNQFEVYSLNMIEKQPCTFEDIERVYDELAHRTNKEILYFCEGRYHSFGTRMFQYKSHYFSK